MDYYYFLMVRLVRIMNHLKIDSWYYIELKNLCVSKKRINRVKRQPMEWEQTIANHIPEKEFIKKIHKWPINTCIKFNITN